MNFNNYLSFKKVLRVAIPCLVLSILFVSCSNEEKIGVSDETPLGTGLTLTATIPTVKQNVSTRIGILDASVTDNPDDEQYVWIGGERLTLHWKNLHEPGFDEVIQYTISSTDGQSCVITPVGTPSINNGYYKIHALSPNATFNKDLMANIDLGNQSQPVNSVNHAYLGAGLYQYATTVVQVHNGNIVSGTTNLPFEFITSLLRVRVVNNTGETLNIDKIKFSFAGANNNQFYSKGIFTANDFDDAHTYGVASDAERSLSITTSKTLTTRAGFDVYIPFFPTSGYTASSSEVLNMEIGYRLNSTSKTFTRNAPVTTAAFRTGTGTNSYLAFDAGDRWFVTLTFQPEDTGGSGAVSPGDIVEMDGKKYLYANNQMLLLTYSSHDYGRAYQVTDFENHPLLTEYVSGYFEVPESLDNICPPRWEVFTYDKTIPEDWLMASILTDVDFPTGVYYGDNYRDATSYALINVAEGGLYLVDAAWFPNGYGSTDGFKIPIRCRQK